MDCKLITDDIENATKNGLRGLASFNQEIACFDYGNIVVQRNYLDVENVRIFSGGGQCYGLFVGKGMLTCAIQGKNVLRFLINI